MTGVGSYVDTGLNACNTQHLRKDCEESGQRAGVEGHSSNLVLHLYEVGGLERQIFKKNCQTRSSRGPDNSSPFTPGIIMRSVSGYTV